MLAIVKSCIKFKLFLLPKPFKIISDNTQVVSLIKNNHSNDEFYSRIHNWRMILSHYKFSIEYVKGIDNFDADYLSRDGHHLKEGR